MEESNFEITQDAKNMALLSHLVTFCGYAFPFGNILAPLIVFLVKKDESHYIRHHAAEALNFQISMTIYAFISLILAFFVIGIFFLLILAVVDLVFTIIAAIRASEGVYYEYPMTLRFVR